MGPISDITPIVCGECGVGNYVMSMMGAGKCSNPACMHLVAPSRDIEPHLEPVETMVWVLARATDEDKVFAEKSASSYYCAKCHHPHGYHNNPRGCSMPLNSRGHVLGRNEEQASVCRCEGDGNG